MTRYRKFSKDKFLYSIGEIRRKTFRPYTIKLSTLKTAEKVRRISLQLNQYDPTTQRFKEGLAKLTKGAKA
ncbi:hypothetical protein N7527_010377 [Penicillium freii]|nr:hypothetical protein N7527_010377 [Penicillium freii]